MEIKSAKKLTTGQTLFASDGKTYEVPAYAPRAGKSVDAVAKELGGRVPGRSERAVAEQSRAVFAVITDGGLTFPVIKV